MFNWLRRWRANRRRQIYRFWDGYQSRAVDPVAVLRLLQSDPEFSAERDLPAMEQGDEQASRIVLDAVRRAFGVSAWSDSTPGLTESETANLFVDFTDWLDAQKKNTSPTPTSPPATESPAVSTMNSGSACG